MDFKDYFEVLARQKLIIFITGVLAVAAATGLTLMMTPIYSASALLRLSPPVVGTVDYAEMTYADRVNSTYIRILTGWPVMDTVASKLNIPRSGLEKKIKVEAVRDTELIRITVEDPDRNVAKNIASTLTDVALQENQRLAGASSAQDTLAAQLNAIQKELANERAALSSSSIATSTAESNGARIRSLEETYSLLLGQYEQSRVRQALLANSVTVVEPASASGVPVKPNKEQNIALGAVLGILAGIGLAFLRENMNNVVRTTEDLERALKISVLGTLPKFRVKSNLPEIIIGSSAGGHAIERYRLLRASIQAAGVDNQYKTLLFTSSGQGEGKSTVVANLAVAAAQAKQRVVVVDADFRRPSMNKVFGLSNDKGFSQALLREQNIKSLLRSTEYEGLKVLTSGPNPPNPDVALDPRAVGAVLSELTQTFDLVLFDGPPALIVADACLIAPLFDGVIVVTKYDHTPPSELRRIVAQLKAVNANVIGTVLNGYRPNGTAYYYNKYYQHASIDTGEW